MYVLMYSRKQEIRSGVNIARYRKRLYLNFFYKSFCNKQEAVIPYSLRLLDDKCLFFHRRVTEPSILYFVDHASRNDLDKWPTWRTILFYIIIFNFNSLHVSSTSCSSSGETNCVNTTSGNCHSMSVAVSCAGRKWTSDLHMTQPPTAIRSCIDTICLSWWWARCGRNM